LSRPGRSLAIDQRFPKAEIQAAIIEATRQFDAADHKDFSVLAQGLSLISRESYAAKLAPRAYQLWRKEYPEFSIAQGEAQRLSGQEKVIWPRYKAFHSTLAEVETIGDLALEVAARPYPQDRQERTIYLSPDRSSFASFASPPRPVLVTVPNALPNVPPVWIIATHPKPPKYPPYRISQTTWIFSRLPALGEVDTAIDWLLRLEKTIPHRQYATTEVEKLIKSSGTTDNFATRIRLLGALATHSSGQSLALPWPGIWEFLGHIAEETPIVTPEIAWHLIDKNLGQSPVGRKAAAIYMRHVFEQNPPASSPDRIPAYHSRMQRTYDWVDELRTVIQGTWLVEELKIEHAISADDPAGLRYLQLGELSSEPTAWMKRAPIEIKLFSDSLKRHGKTFQNREFLSKLGSLRESDEELSNTLVPLLKTFIETAPEGSTKDPVYERASYFLGSRPESTSDQLQNLPPSALLVTHLQRNEPDQAQALATSTDLSVMDWQYPMNFQLTPEFTANALLIAERLKATDDQSADQLIRSLYLNLLSTGYGGKSRTAPSMGLVKEFAKLPAEGPTGYQAMHDRLKKFAFGFSGAGPELATQLNRWRDPIRGDEQRFLRTIWSDNSSYRSHSLNQSRRYTELLIHQEDVEDLRSWFQMITESRPKAPAHDTGRFHRGGSALPLHQAAACQQILRNLAKRKRQAIPTAREQLDIVLAPREPESKTNSMFSHHGPPPFQRTTFEVIRQLLDTHPGEDEPSQTWSGALAKRLDLMPQENLLTTGVESWATVLPVLASVSTNQTEATATLLEIINSALLGNLLHRGGDVLFSRAVDLKLLSSKQAIDLLQKTAPAPGEPDPDGAVRRIDEALLMHGIGNSERSNELLAEALELARSPKSGKFSIARYKQLHQRLAEAKRLIETGKWESK